MNKLATIKVNTEFLNHLDLLDTKIYPLPGGTGRAFYSDSRIKDSAKSDIVTFYEHIASIRYRTSVNSTKEVYYVAFKETMDAFLARQTDITKYPKWLMDSKEKQVERKIYIYKVYKNPKKLGIIQSHEDWLEQITNEEEFETISYFLYKANVIDESVLAKMKN